jgi:hypothetical protein
MLRDAELGFQSVRPTAGRWDRAAATRTG